MTDLFELDAIFKVGTSLLLTRSTSTYTVAVLVCVDVPLLNFGFLSTLGREWGEADTSPQARPTGP